MRGERAESIIAEAGRGCRLAEVVVHVELNLGTVRALIRVVEILQRAVVIARQTSRAQV